MNKTISKAVLEFGLPCLIFGISQAAIPIMVVGVGMIILSRLLKPKTSEPFESFTMVAGFLASLAFLGVDSLNPIPASIAQLVLSVILTVAASIGFLASVVVKLVLENKRDENKEN